MSERESEGEIDREKERDITLRALDRAGDSHGAFGCHIRNAQHERNESLGLSVNLFN